VSFRFITPVDLLLKRYSPDFFFVSANGEIGLDLLMVFLGGLGPSGEMTEVTMELVDCLFVTSFTPNSSNSSPREKGGASHPKKLFRLAASAWVSACIVMNVSVTFRICIQKT
jgi:hypothetical protein